MVIVIGIAGPTTSGKSTIAERLKKVFNCESVCVDKYFKRNKDLPKTEINGVNILNYDSPRAIEWSCFAKDLRDKIEEMETTKSSNFLIVEGFLLFGTAEISEMIDIVIVVEYDIGRDKYVALHRRLNRMKNRKSTHEKDPNIAMIESSGRAVIKSDKSEEDAPDDYLENPLRSLVTYASFYFMEVAWKQIELNQYYICPKDWEKPILRLSATANLDENINKSIEFIGTYN
jgi:adenylate kinase family enzyme